MINHKVQVGVLGGARGNTMIQELLQHPDAELVAVCDKYEPLLDKVKEEAQKVGLNVALYTDFDEFLKHPGMDAVVLRKAVLVMRSSFAAMSAVKEGCATRTSPF